MLRQSPFALGVVSSFNPADLDYLATLGNPNGGVRITFYWKMIEPQETNRETGRVWLTGVFCPSAPESQPGLFRESRLSQEVH
jgi:hypothetical protein